MTRAIAYIRVSSAEQVEGTSLGTQERQCIEYAVRNGYELVMLFREEGESAKTADRHALQEMLRYCKEHAKTIDRLIIPKIDRFARYVEDYTTLKHVLQRLGIQIESVGERLENSPVGRFTEHMLASAAQFDNEIRAERCKGGMLEAVRQGRWCWKAPYGYVNGKVDGKPNIVPVDPARHFVAKAFQHISASNAAAEETRRALFREGMRTSRGKPYTLDMFLKLLRNPIYTGRIVSFGMDNPGSFEPLVSWETFLAVQDVLEGRRRAIPKYRTLNPDFPLRGTLLCQCGAKYTASWSTGRSGKKYGNYRCNRCVRLNQPKETVETQFLSYLSSLSLSQDDAAKIAGKIRGTLSERLASRDKARKNLRLKIGELKEAESGLARKSATGVIPDAVAKVQLECVGSEIRGLEADLDAVNNVNALAAEAMEYGLRAMTDLASLWDACGPSTRRRFQILFFREGLTYTRNRKFGTASSLLLQHKKDLSRAKSLCWWTQGHGIGTGAVFDEALNDLRELNEIAAEVRGNSRKILAEAPPAVSDAPAIALSSPTDTVKVAVWPKRRQSLEV